MPLRRCVLASRSLRCSLVVSGGVWVGVCATFIDQALSLVGCPFTVVGQAFTLVRDRFALVRHALALGGRPLAVVHLTEQGVRRTFAARDRDLTVFGNRFAFVCDALTLGRDVLAFIGDQLALGGDLLPFAGDGAAAVTTGGTVAVRLTPLARVLRCVSLIRPAPPGVRR